MKTQTRVCLYGVPMDLGRGHRGVDMGPSGFRIAGIREGIESLGLTFEDRGNIPVEISQRLVPEDEKARFIREIADACEHLRDAVESVMDEGHFPLVVGGDHSIACGTIAGVTRHFKKRNEEIGLIWFDAHGDFNTPDTSPTGNVHGMPLASCLGYGDDRLVKLAGHVPMIKPENVVLIGIRDIDQAERELIKESGIKTYTMYDIDRLGMARVAQEALEHVTRNTVGFHVSFDLDGCDPTIARGVGTPVPGGVGFRESHYLLESVAMTGKMVSLEMTEIDPLLDNGNSTAELARDLVLSALGKSIL
jgi:arginase